MHSATNFSHYPEDLLQPKMYNFESLSTIKKNQNSMSGIVYKNNSKKI